MRSQCHPSSTGTLLVYLSKLLVVVVVVVGFHHHPICNHTNNHHHNDNEQSTTTSSDGPIGWIRYVRSTVGVDGASQQGLCSEMGTLVPRPAGKCRVFGRGTTTTLHTARTSIDT